MKKKVLFYLLMVSLVVLLLPAVAFAARFSDMPEDWSTNALQNAVDNGLLTGANGRIMPKDTLTRAQMAVIISRAFGATEKAVLDGYTDVSPGAWYYDDMARVVQMKSFMGSGDKLNPNKAITREEAFVVLARAFKLSGSSVSILDKYTDKSEVSSWAKDSTASLVAATYITGTDGRLNPKKNITRAEFAQIMYNLLKNYIRSSGTYTDVAEGNVMINVPDVTLKDVTVKGDLIIGDGVGAGDVTLENVKVTGRTVVRGGGINSIKIIGNSEVGSVIIAKVNGNVRVVAENAATVEVVYIDDGEDDVVIEGTIGSIEVAGSNVPVRLQNAQVENVTISAQEVNLTVANTATVNKVTVSQTAEGTLISGEGTVKNAIIQGDNTSVDTIGTKIEVGKAVSGTEIGGQSIAGGAIGTTSSNGGLTLPSSGGGGGSSTVAVSTITVTGQGDATTVINGGTLQLSATVTPANATNKTITWSVAPLAGGVATIDENGLLTGAGAGTVLVTATNSASGITGTLEVTVITVDKSELTAGITAEVGADHENPVYVLAQADYTSTTWASYADAIAAAIAVETNVNAVQSEVDVVLEQIITTKTALVFAGQADLDTAKAAAGALTEGDYTTATWSALETALALPETSNAEVVAKTTAINNAIAGLIEVADLTAYNAALAAVVEADYTQESWDMYQTVVDGSTVTDQNLQAEVNTATAAIIAAQANLVFAGQADLDVAKAATGNLTEGDYTTATWSALETALALPETSNTEVVAKTTAIDNAIAGLIEVADLTAYNAALAAVVEADYTQESWAMYQTVVDGNTVTDQNLQAEVDTATATIIAAQANLVFPGQADLDTAKATAGALSEGDYTTATWSALEIALALPETSNAEVVAKTTAINNAIAGLIEVADLTAYNAALAAVVEADYTQESWDMYQTVVDGNAVTDQNLQAEVDTATATIIAAQANLVFAGQADLDTAKAAAGALSEREYTTATWSALQIALALPETSNAEVVTKTTAINNAITDLVLIPANSSYVLEITLPEQTIISSQEATLAVTLSEAVIGHAGYDNVRVNVTASGGTIVQVPVAWGTGFAIGAEYNTTENISVLYSAGGDYDLTVTLVDANNGDQVLASDTVSVHVYSAVATAEDLNNVRNNLAGDYIQVANIDLIGYPDWDPIGGLYNEFTGSYNGNGYEISNLTAVIDSDYNYGGLFGEIWGAVENVTLKGVTITCTAQYPYAMGGLAGYLGETGTINNCSAEVSITGSGTAYVGGLVGWAYSGTIEQSSAVGSVSQSGNGDTGGLVGGSRSANIRRSFAAVDVSSNGYSAGGLVGNNGGLIEQSYATGDVTSTNYWVGGLVGDNRPFDVPCIVSECYATGKVTGAGSLGGLLGLSEDATVQKSYYDMNTTGCTDVGKGIPKTTVEMMQQATFADWDFSDTWIIGEGITYPYFQWQSL